MRGAMSAWWVGVGGGCWWVCVWGRAESGVCGWVGDLVGGYAHTQTHRQTDTHVSHSHRPPTAPNSAHTHTYLELPLHHIDPSRQRGQKARGRTAPADARRGVARTAAAAAAAGLLWGNGTGCEGARMVVASFMLVFCFCRVLTERRRATPRTPHHTTTYIYHPSLPLFTTCGGGRAKGPRKRDSGSCTRRIYPDTSSSSSSSSPSPSSSSCPCCSPRLSSSPLIPWLPPPAPAAAVTGVKDGVGE